jgi:nucleotide-binding universal stress UspA family protein
VGNGARPAPKRNLSEDSMFRITAGIDFEHYQKALSIVQRLKPANGAIDLIHVVESLLPDESFPNLASTHPVAMIMAERNRQGHAELDKAESLLEGSGLQINKLMTQGDPPREILDQANSSGADLIAVGSGKKGTWSSLFFGSVTKALAVQATQSILVAKNSVTHSNGLHLVFAVDDSEYCGECLDLFLTWELKGIRRVTLVRSAPPLIIPGEIPVSDFVEINQDIEARAKDHLEGVADRMRSAGYEVDTILTQRHINLAIDDAMKTLGGDLLVLGARGHGLLDRITLGSISHYHVVGTPYNVLVVRVK